MAGYVNQGGQLVPYLFQHDVVNSVAATSKANGGASATASYFVFGETQSTTGAAVSRLKYTGREDDGTGLYQYRARYYDPSIGRFVSEDPAGFQGSGANWYAYVGNNPVNATDPTGKEPYTAYPTYQDAQYAAARYNAELTLGVIQYYGKTQEYGSYIYKLGDSYYHTQPVTSGIVNEVSAEDYAYLRSIVPPSTEIGRSHSHPPGPNYGQGPSPGDISGASSLGDTVGRVDGSAAFFTPGNTQTIFNPITRSIEKTNTTILPSTGPLTPRDPAFEFAPPIDIYNSLGPSNSVNNGFVTYPSKSNTNATRVIYAK